MSTSPTTPFVMADYLTVVPSRTLATAALPGGVMAYAGRSQTAGSALSLPAFDESLLFIHLSEKMHLKLRIDQTYEADSSSGYMTLIPRGHPTDWYAEGSAEALIVSMPNTQFLRTLLQAASADRTDFELIPRVSYADPLIHVIGEAIFDSDAMWWNAW